MTGRTSRPAAPIAWKSRNNDGRKKVALHISMNAPIATDSGARLILWNRKHAAVKQLCAFVHEALPREEIRQLVKGASSSPPKEARQKMAAMAHRRSRPLAAVFARTK